MQLPDLVGMYLNRYLIEPIAEALNVSENIIIWILIGIGIIIIGYWSKLYVYRWNRASPLVEETSKRIREKRLLNEKLTLNQRATLWIEDGYGVKLCNKIGAMIIIIAILWGILESLIRVYNNCL